MTERAFMPRLFPAALFALLALAPLAPARAQLAEAVRRFDEGNRHYQQGDYRRALAAYQAALDAGYASGALYYNMGNAHYRLDALGQAVRYYEKARRLLPDHPALQHNLEITRGRTLDAFSQLPTPFWRPPWQRLVYLVGPPGFFLAGLVCYVLALALVAYRIRTRTRNPWHRRSLALSLGFSLLLLTTAFAASLEHARDTAAVVVASSASLRHGPADDAPTDLDVHEGLLLDVLGTHDDWLQVRLPNGVTGWLPARAVADV